MMRFLAGVLLMYRYCRDGMDGYGNPRLYSLRAAISWSWRYR